MILTGRDLQWYIETKKLIITPTTPIQFQQNGFDSILYDAEFVTDSFFLGCTREWFALPDDLMAFVGVRSTWARKGFSVPMTIVDAGYKGELTLEVNRHVIREPVPIGERFAHLVFARTTGPAEPYKGRYQGQRGITKARSD